MLRSTDFQVDEKVRLTVIPLSEEDKATIRQGKIPTGFDLFSAIYRSLWRDLPRPHGKNDKTIHEYNAETGEIGPELPKDYKRTYKGLKKTLYSHSHDSVDLQKTDTTHAAWHTFNDTALAIRDFLEEEERTVEIEEAREEPEPEPVPTGKPRKKAKRKASTSSLREFKL